MKTNTMFLKSKYFTAVCILQVISDQCFRLRSGLHCVGYSLTSDQCRE